MGSTRRTFSSEYKQGAIKLVLEEGQPYSRVATNLGIGEPTLRRWVKEHQEHGAKAFPGRGMPIEQELAQLRRELAVTREEGDILIRATIYFAMKSWYPAFLNSFRSKIKMVAPWGKSAKLAQRTM